MTALRAGIVGAGWIACRHVLALDAADGVELVAVCDVDPERARAIAAPRDAAVHARWEELVERERLDVLWVCTPPLHHRGPVVAALERGIHVYLEKPIARTPADAAAIVAAAAGSAAICAVGYQWHASELLDDARRALAGQRIGMLVGRNFGPTAGRPWFVDQAQGGGQVLERGSHHIDLQRAIAGEVESVQAVAGAVRLAQAGAGIGDVDDAIVLLLRFASGALGAVHSVWSRDGQPGIYATDILAEDATVVLELGPDAYRIHGVAAGAALDASYGDPMDRSVAGFLDAVRDGQRARVFCTPADALETLRVALACERALETGAEVAV